MAKASSRTVSYDIESDLGVKRVLLERSFVKTTRVANKYVSATKEFALFDEDGRRYERISDFQVKCVSTSEHFRVTGHADKIRKSPIAG